MSRRVPVRDLIEVLLTVGVWALSVAILGGVAFAYGVTVGWFG